MALPNYVGGARALFWGLALLLILGIVSDASAEVCRNRFVSCSDHVCDSQLLCTDASAIESHNIASVAAGVSSTAILADTPEALLSNLLFNLSVEECHRVIEALAPVQDSINRVLLKFKEDIDAIHPAFRLSVINLLQYMALRQHDITEAQEVLSTFGLSSLGRSEAHVQYTLVRVLNTLTVLAGFHAGQEGSRTFQPHATPVGSLPSLAHNHSFVSYHGGRKLLHRHTEGLLGHRPQNRFVRIMVTMSTEAAEKYELVRDLVKSGMNVMRINTAHDSPEVWQKMIDNLERAKVETGHDCKVLMDLSGPKLRTGDLEPGPQVVKISTEKNIFGRVVHPTYVWLTPSEAPEKAPSSLPPGVGGPGVDLRDTVTLPFPSEFLRQLAPGDRLSVEDTRGKDREFRVVARGDAQQGKNASLWADTDATAFIAAGTVFHVKPLRGTGGRYRDGMTIVAGRVGPLPAVEVPIRLRPGDQLLVTRDHTIGRPAQYDADGRQVAMATISCTLPEVFDQAKIGEPIWFDDGKIASAIHSIDSEAGLIIVNVTMASGDPVKGTTLLADKGINLPESHLQIQSITDKDREDLEFVSKHADMIGLSFVDDPEDVDELRELLTTRYNVTRPLAIILKIETRRGFEQLPRILLRSMRHYPLGVMIARGDLAVEAGYVPLAELQEEILWICEAAHVPVIWATQVLETLAKKGTPTRAEITDAAMSGRAECVMLNKGPYIVKAVEVLDDILSRMQVHHRKKSSKLPHMKFADMLVDSN